MALDLGNILQVATLVTIIGGLVFGLMEVRSARRARVNAGARDVLSIAINPGHIEACYGILELPVGAQPELVANSPELKRFANTLMVQYEYLGNLVYQRIVPFDTLSRNQEVLCPCLP